MDKCCFCGDKTDQREMGVPVCVQCNEENIGLDEGLNDEPIDSPPVDDLMWGKL